MVSFMMPERSGATRSSESSADAEHKCRGKRYKWQKDSRGSHYGSQSTGDEGGHRGVDSVHKPEPAADKIAGQDEAQCARSESDNDLQHMDFRI